MKLIRLSKKRLRGSVLMVLFLLAGMLLFPRPVLEEGKRAMELVLFYVAPSLFPFFICTHILIGAGFADAVSKGLQPLMRPLFRLSGACSLCLILGTLCGYPVGAKTTGMLYRKGYVTREEAERTLGFCNNAGPLFILGTVASGFFGNAAAGDILIVSHVAAALTVGILLRFRGGHVSASAGSAAAEAKPGLEQNLLANAITSAIKTMAQVGGYILLFAALIQIIDCVFAACGANSVPLFSAPILELTTGIRRLAQTSAPFPLKLILTSVILGFGGVCVYCQIRTIAGEAGLSMRYYLPCKLAQGILSAGYTALLLRLFPATQGVFSYVPFPTPAMEMNFSKIFFFATGYILFAIFVLAAVSFLLNLFVRRQ